MDKQQQDCKFVTARHVPENEVSVGTVFVGVVCSKKSGAVVVCSKKSLGFPVLQP